LVGGEASTVAAPFLRRPGRPPTPAARTSCSGLTSSHQIRPRCGAEEGAGIRRRSSRRARWSPPMSCTPLSDSPHRGGAGGRREEKVV
jgi:hypothetical protein